MSAIPGRASAERPDRHRLVRPPHRPPEDHRRLRRQRLAQHLERPTELPRPRPAHRVVERDHEARPRRRAQPRLHQRPGLQVVRQRQRAEVVPERRAAPAPPPPASPSPPAPWPPRSPASPPARPRSPRRPPPPSRRPRDRRPTPPPPRRPAAASASAARARASSSRLSERVRHLLGPRAPAARDRAHSRRDRSPPPPPPAPRRSSGRPAPARARRPPAARSRPPLPARHQHQREIGARSSGFSASRTVARRRHRRPFDIDRPRELARRRQRPRIFARLRPTFMITAASQSPSRRTSSASRQRPRQHAQHVVALHQRQPGLRPGPRHRRDPGDHLRRVPRRQPHVQVHVGAVEKRIALAQHRHRPPPRVRLDRLRRPRIESLDRRAIGRRRAAGSRSSPGKAAPAPRPPAADRPPLSAARCRCARPWRSAPPRRPRPAP